MGMLLVALSVQMFMAGEFLHLNYLTRWPHRATATDHHDDRAAVIIDRQDGAHSRSSSR